VCRRILVAAAEAPTCRLLGHSLHGKKGIIEGLGVLGCAQHRGVVVKVASSSGTIYAFAVRGARARTRDGVGQDRGVAGLQSAFGAL